ncbi:MAG TPA: hypothetical protein VK533_15150 [Sphingomonas sp.]|uniref:hypothetical protein n=1 Tax=Sphingomonas sp. TaxID=28214 RepID=UPI002C2E247F|nr:hypothetical protein [Sphingomonas sp.]HMI20871.1 hypothetical protein [Sphingomonas sp.]
MARDAAIQALSGSAGDAAQIRANPLCAVSRPLYLNADGTKMPGLADWQLPVPPGASGDRTVAQAEKRNNVFLGTEKLVVLGNFNFLIEAGVVAEWLKDPLTRADGMSLIEERGWRPILTRLAGKEHHDDDLIGMGALDEFFKNSPKARAGTATGREANRSPAERAKAALEMRAKHPLRLRKAIEIITLAEAALSYRLPRKHDTRARIEAYTRTQGFTADMIWDWMWFEPIHYVLSNLPADYQSAQIMRDDPLVKRFMNASGQQAGALFYILKGAPAKFETVQAAVAVVNSTLPENFWVNATTVKPDETKSMRQTCKPFSEPAKREYQQSVEYAPCLGFRR